MTGWHSRGKRAAQPHKNLAWLTDALKGPLANLKSAQQLHSGEKGLSASQPSTH
jgi:hypothetical protein